ncbi:DUF4082 domain-containing protein [Nocardioides glacieisoli]|uniref:DUF4082 domain-containing protein n=1 Tax=Nocardioides glacieisoli TaxID=1168730 RepID=A0A4Q2RTM4_9ACTN|nr:DUF4082 domain-containing protein [Nocardioides glacieisoli]RYB90723.1 DUF4082 domain-containing protein [Nocardioides glacieisoli]
MIRVIPLLRRRRPRWLQLRVVATLLIGLGTVVPLAVLPLAEPADAASTTGILGSKMRPTTRAVPQKTSVNLGVKFTSRRAGQVTALQFYRSPRQTKSYVASLWDNDGTLLGRTRFRASDRSGWQTAKLRSPVRLLEGRVYVASYLASHGQHAVKRGGFARKRTVNGFTVNPGGGVRTRSNKSRAPRNSAGGANFLVDVVFTPQRSAPTATPTPTTTPTPIPGGWPGPDNTGVPNGTTLSPYSGPLTVTTANTVIQNVVVNGTLEIAAPGVRIVNTRVNGHVDLRDPRTSGASFTITDSEIHVGATLTTGLLRGNFTATRIEVTGGMRSIYCEINCVVEDSWVHAQGGDPGGSTHFGGIRMGESTTLRHNTITCEAMRGPGTGCSAGLTGYGDFGPIQNNLIERNIFLGGGGGGSTVCAYGGSSGDDGSKPYGHLANNVRFVGNVFVRGASGTCGNIRAVSGFDPTRPGNLWSGNTWDDGTPVNYTD